MSEQINEGLISRWTLDQRCKAQGIVNDIAEEIDNGESRDELRQALAIYADYLYDALQDRACKKTTELIKQVNRLAEIMSANKTPTPVARLDGEG